MKSKVKKGFCLIFISILVVSIMGFSTTGISQKKYEGVTLNIAFCKWVPLETFASYAQEVAEDMGIDLNVAWHTFDGQRTKLLMDYRGGVPAWDIVYLDPRWLAEFAEEGVIVPIEPYLKPDFDLKDLLPKVREEITYKGKIWSLAGEFNGVLMAYRTDLFNNPEEKEKFKQKYGYELQPPNTYQQFYDVAEFFTRKKGEKLAGKTLENDFYGTAHSNKKGNYIYHDYFSYMWGFGGRLFDKETLMPTWDSVENMTAGRFYASLARFLPPGHGTMTSGETTSMFASGQVAMILEWADRCQAMLEEAETKVEGRYAYAPHPLRAGVPGEYRGAGGLSNIAIFSLSQHKEAAAELIQRVLSKEGVKKMTLNYKYLPARKSVLNDPEVKANVPYLKKLGEIPETWEFTHRDVCPYPVVRVYPQIVEITSLAVNEAVTRQKTVEQAFGEAQKKMVDLFKEKGYIK